MKEGAGTYQLAGAADEEDLRVLVRQTPMAGPIRVAFTREPDYFAADGLAGADDHTLIHRQNGCLDGVARLSVQTLYRDGMAQRIAYLGELRLVPGAQNPAQLLRGGYAELHRQLLSMEGDRAPRCCFTSIASGNARARRVLENGGKLGLPTYKPIADLVTRVLPIRKARSEPLGDVDGGVNDDVETEELSDFLDSHAKRKQLGLTWDVARWQELRRHGITPGSFEVVREAGRIVGAGAVWDQRAFRQVVICGYSGLLRWARPLIHALSKIGLAPPLPAPPATLAQGMVLGAAVEEERHWRPLWQALLGNAAARGLRWLTIARDVRDPELATLRKLGRAREYPTRLYEVSWRDWPAESRDWSNLPFRPEAALL